MKTLNKQQFKIFFMTSTVLADCSGTVVCDEVAEVLTFDRITEKYNESESISFEEDQYKLSENQWRKIYSLIDSSEQDWIESQDMAFTNEDFSHALYLIHI